MNLNVDTLVPLALITNELISNSLKHAFVDKEDGEITLGFRQENDSLILEQSDNGCGFIFAEMESQDSFGFQLIEILTQKLKGKYTWRGEASAHFILKCPKSQEYES